MVVLALALTNPNIDQHRQEFVSAADTYNLNNHPYATLLGASHFTAVTMSYTLEYENCMLFSFTKDQRGQVVTCGLLGGVSVDKDALRDIVEN